MRLDENLPHFSGHFEDRGTFVGNFEFDGIFEGPDDVFLEIMEDGVVPVMLYGVLWVLWQLRGGLCASILGGFGGWQFEGGLIM